MLECRYYCPENMIRLSGVLRQINKASVDNELLQNQINQLIKKLDAHGHASNIAHVLLQDILGASTERLVPLLQCIVKSLTKLRGNVLACFEFWLPDSIQDIFEDLCEKNDTRTRLDLLSLQSEWRILFSLETLTDINQRLHRLDPQWPVFESVQVPALSDQIDTTVYRTNALSLKHSKSSSSVQKTALSTEITKSDSLVSLRKYESPLGLLQKVVPPKPKKVNLNAKEKYQKVSSTRTQPLESHKTMTAKRLTTRYRLSSLGSSSNSDKENDSYDFFQNS